MVRFFWTVMFITVFQTLQGQQLSEDTASTYAYTSRIYSEHRKNELAIYNGPLHNPYPSSIEGVAYFLTDEWQKGTVVYDGILYSDILMKYDMVADQLVITYSATSGVAISLFSPRVREFEFSGYKFIRINKNEGVSSPAEGFYQVLAEGKATALARRTKTILEQVRDNTLYRKFESHEKYFIVRDGVYYSVNNKNSLLNALKDKRSNVQAFISEKSLNYRREAEKTIVSAAEFYNQ